MSYSAKSNFKTAGAWVSAVLYDQTDRKVTTCGAFGLLIQKDQKELPAAHARRFFEVGMGLVSKPAKEGSWLSPRSEGVPYSWVEYNHFGGALWDKALLARMVGWAQALNGNQLLGAFVSATMKGDGVNSPKNLTSLQQWVESEKSPGAMLRRAVAIRRRANEILSPLGIKISKAAVGMAALRGTKGSVGKAAMQAIAWHLKNVPLSYADRGSEVLSYKEARAFVIGTLSGRRQEIDGVQERVLSTEVLHGFTVESVVREVAVNGTLLGFGPKEFTVKRGEWSFHAGECRRQVALNNEWVEANPRDVAVKEAIRALRLQRAAELQAAASKQLLDAVESGKVVVLATWKDSYDAGNCVAGTDAFAQRNGFEGRLWIDVQHLMHSGDPRAVNAGKVALKKAMDWLEEGKVEIAA